MDREIKAYVNADRKARTLWGKSKQTNNPRKQHRLQEKAKDSYAERDAYAMRLNNPKAEVRSTNVKFQNSFNGNLNKTKKTSVKTTARFNFFKNKDK